MRIKIGFNARCLADPEVRGLSRYTGELLRALSACPNIELCLFSDLPPHPLHLQGIRAQVVIFQAAREFLWNDWLLPQKLREYHIDLFHAPADRGLPLRKPCPLVVTVHSSYERTHWPKLFTRPKNRLWYWKYEFINYFLADVVLTVSDTTKNELARLGVAPRRKLEKVHLAPAPGFHSQAGPKDAAIMHQYGIKPPFLLYVGGYDRHKNTAALVQAFEQAVLPEHTLVIIALKKWDYLRLLEGWRQLSCFPRLRLLEAPSEEIPAFYRQADFFVNPSRHESFSFQLVEAMACGAPVLASNRTAIPEILGDAGLLFDPEDVNGLARLLERLAADGKLKQEIREKGLQRIKSFSWDKTARETLQVYGQVLGRSLI